MIKKYYFGSIAIDGKTHNHDVEVRWTGEVLAWQRKESHVIDVKAVERAVKEEPKIIVIGTGESGAAEVLEETRKFIKEKGIELIIDKTEQAAKTFNIINEESVEENGEQKKIIGLFHLTC